MKRKLMFLTLCGLLLTGCADSAIHYKVESSDSVTKTTAVLWDENYFCDNQCSDEELEKIFNKDKYKDEEVEKATTDVITKTAPNNRLVGMRADGKLTKEATEKYITSYIEGDNEVIEFRYPIKDLLKDMEDEINTYLGTTEGSFKDAESLVEAYFDVSLESGLSPLDEIISTTIYESAKDVEKNKTSINKYKDEFTQKQQTAVNKYLEYFEITSTRGALEVYKKISKLDDIESEKVINMIDFMKKAKEGTTDKETIIAYKDLGMRSELSITMPTTPITNFGKVEGNTVTVNLMDTNLLKLNDLVITCSKPIAQETKKEDSFFNSTTVYVLGATAIGFLLVLLIGINSKKSDINFYER